MTDQTRGPNDDVAVTPAHAGPEHAEPAVFAREVWGTRLGFILAAVGSAVGLGNMWRFPYATAENGGAAFVVLYIIMTFMIGIPIMLAEFSVGRSTRLSPIGALRKAGGRGWAPLGYLFAATGFLILGYYSVIAGWVTRYALVGLLTGFPEPAAAGDYFGGIAFGLPAVGFHLFFMALTIGIVMGGVEKGIERASLLMMPSLFILIAGLAVWAATLAGSGAGYAFYLAPSLSELFKAQTISAAAGQAFFSLSLGMGAMLTFSSYLSRQESLPREATVIAFSDFGVAFVAGLVVFPVIFAFALGAQVSESAVGALFISLPSAFASMGVVGRVVGTLFFLALMIGALTSAVSLLEVVTSSIIDEWGIKRKTAAVGAGTLIAILGFWPAMDPEGLGAFDAVASDVFLPLGGLALAIFVGWLMRNPLDEVLRGTGPRLRPWGQAWIWLLRVIAPVLLVIVLYINLQKAWQAVQAIFAG